MELVFSCAIIKFQKKFLKKFFGIVMGTNLASTLAKIYIGYVGRRATNYMQK